MILVAPPRVGVGVDARVPGELVGPAEAFCASGIPADMRLLASVGADVPGLVLQAVEGLVTERALVRPGELCPLVVHVLLRAADHGVKSTQAALVHGVIPLVFAVMIGHGSGWEEGWKLVVWTEVVVLIDERWYAGGCGRPLHWTVCVGGSEV